MIDSDSLSETETTQKRSQKSKIEVPTKETTKSGQGNISEDSQDPEKSRKNLNIDEMKEVEFSEAEKDNLADIGESETNQDEATVEPKRTTKTRQVRTPPRFKPTPTPPPRVRKQTYRDIKREEREKKKQEKDAEKLRKQQLKDEKKREKEEKQKQKKRYMKVKGEWVRDNIDNPSSDDSIFNTKDDDDLKDNYFANLSSDEDEAIKPPNVEKLKSPTNPSKQSPARVRKKRSPSEAPARKGRRLIDSDDDAKSDDDLYS